MMTPAFISKWLGNPQMIEDENELGRVIEQYPYFLPARYMAAASDHKLAPGTGHAYAAHPLLYQEKIAVKTPLVMHVSDEVAAAIKPVFEPVFTEDYFRHQGLQIEDGLPETAEMKPAQEDPKSLMVMRSFADWLQHFKTKTHEEREEAESRRALKTMWQKEKLAAALDEDGEDDEIPEAVFKMAVDSIAKEDGLVSESLAEILVKQQKWSKAIDMYRRLALTNPAKSTYFAAQIESLQKQNTDHP